jgi:hypothetical protein
VEINMSDCKPSVLSAANGLTPVNKYVAPDLCKGTFDLVNGPCNDESSKYQEQLAAEHLGISGAPINIFKLLGVHEQGKLIDLVGRGKPLGLADPAKAFNVNQTWSSAGLDSTTFIGYDFGVRAGEASDGPFNQEHITSFKITQPDPAFRVAQVKVERSNGEFFVDESGIAFTGVGNGNVTNVSVGPSGAEGYFMLVAFTPTQFQAYFIEGSITHNVGLVAVNRPFTSRFGSFTVFSGAIPFQQGDMFSIPVLMKWYRVDIVNLPDTAAPAHIRIKQSRASRFWKISPTSWAPTNTSWHVSSLQLFDYASTTLDDVQDYLFMENRDRDYASSSVQLKVAYTPFDGVSDMSKFGFQIADIYSFTVSFAEMVKVLGRPIVVGDVLELPSETQYDHNLNPVRKFLEVSDVGWDAQGFTTTWKPIIYRFQAQPVIPSQEHKDIIGTPEQFKYTVDDVDFFGLQQVQTQQITASEQNTVEAEIEVPEKGIDAKDFALGANRFATPNSNSEVGLYVEDGLPKNGEPFVEGFKLPDVSAAVDGEYFRLNYAPETKIPSRLYKFSAHKTKWILVEVDRRPKNVAHRPSQQQIFNMKDKMSLDGKKL